MTPLKMRRIDIFKSMTLSDKLFTVSLTLMGIALFANGLYLVGTNGLLILIGAIIFHFIMEIFKTTEMKIITSELEQTKSPLSSQFPAVGAATNNNDGLIPSIIEKRKRHPQQSLLDSLMNNSATTERDEEQARADHEVLVEMARKRQEAMRTAVPGPPVDPAVGKEVIEKQKAYIKELMKPTIIPQRELAKKAPEKDDG